MRKTIFEQIKDKVSFSSEINRLNALLNDKYGIRIEISPEPLAYIGQKKDVKFYSVENFVDNLGFKQWKCRGTCISCADMRKTLLLDEILKSEQPNEEQVITFVEYVANMLYLSEIIELNKRCEHYGTAVTEAIKVNIESILDWMNLQSVTFDDEEQVLITEKSAIITAVAENVDEELAYQIVKYNHHTLQGDIDKKKAILLVLGSELEPKRKQLTTLNSQLSTNIFFMLNNLNLRHNNRSKRDKNYKEYVAKMSKKKLESWYDELYQMMLLAILELEQIERNIKIDDLKANIEA